MAAGSPKGFSVEPVPISVNGVVIAGAAIAREAQNHPAATALASWKAAARALVVRELLLQEARRAGLSPAPEALGEGVREADEDALIRALMEAEIKALEPSEDNCRRYYAQNQRRFRSSDLYEASHILLAAAPDDREGRAAARTEAVRLIAELAADPGLFAALAASHSACPSAAQGGNLGQITRGQTVPEFEAALAGMAEGETSSLPVESRYGFHVIRLSRKIEGRQLPFEAVAERIAGYLRERGEHEAVYSYVRWLAIHAEVTGIDLETGEVAPAAIAAANPDAALKRFADKASDEDWTTLISAMQGAEDPAAAFAGRVASFEPRPAQPPADSRPQTRFTYTGRT